MSDGYRGPDDGAVLPDQTLDDTDEGWGDLPTGMADPERPDPEGGDSRDDERLLREVPPHHGN